MRHYSVSVCAIVAFTTSIAYSPSSLAAGFSPGLEMDSGIYSIGASEGVGARIVTRAKFKWALRPSVGLALFQNKLDLRFNGLFEQVQFETGGRPAMTGVRAVRSGGSAVLTYDFKQFRLGGSAAYSGESLITLNSETNLDISTVNLLSYSANAAIVLLGPSSNMVSNFVFGRTKTGIRAGARLTRYAASAPSSVTSNKIQSGTGYELTTELTYGDNLPFSLTAGYQWRDFKTDLGTQSSWEGRVGLKILKLPRIKFF